jgi:hypothetical protein
VLSAFFGILFRGALGAYLAVALAHAQPASGLLARLDQFARTFRGANANLANTVYNIGIDDDEKNAGALASQTGLIRRERAFGVMARR